MAQGLSNEVIARSDLSPFDPRAVDIILEYPADSIQVWRRPWVQALQVDGYPVEFRVFVRDGSIQGIASYYPQRPLPVTPEMLAYVEGCREATYNILAHLVRSQERPWMPSYEKRYSDQLPSATLDFLVDTSGQVLFLEAGPPLGAGAHPCAFIDRDEMSGVALELAPGAQLR